MNNLGGFKSQFKQSISQAKQQVSRLKKQKLDTSELEDLIAQAQAKGDEILGLMKAQPLDEDTIMNSMEELQNLRQEFSDKVSELTGQETTMPWQQGPQQFNPISLPPAVGKYLQPQSTQQQQQPGGGCAPGTTCGGPGGGQPGTNNDQNPNQNPPGENTTNQGQ